MKNAIPEVSPVHVYGLSHLYQFSTLKNDMKTYEIKKESIPYFLQFFMTFSLVFVL